MKDIFLEEDMPAEDTGNEGSASSDDTDMPPEDTGTEGS